MLWQVVERKIGRAGSEQRRTTPPRLKSWALFGCQCHPVETWLTAAGITLATE